MVRNMRAVQKTGSCGTRRIFRGTRCAKQASTVRKRYSVPKTAFSGTRRIFKGALNSRLHRLWTASWGTRRIFRGTRCAKQASTVRKRYSVPKTAFSGTRRIFKGALNSRLHRLWTASWGTRRIFRGIRCKKQAFSVRKGYSVRRTADSTDCGQPPAHRT